MRPVIEILPPEQQSGMFLKQGTQVAEMPRRHHVLKRDSRDFDTERRRQRFGLKLGHSEASTDLASISSGLRSLTMGQATDLALFKSPFGSMRFFHARWL